MCCRHTQGAARLDSHSRLFLQLGCAFPWGRFLSEGAYKQVFMTVFKPLGRVEAVAVMDIRQIAETGNEAIVAQEVQVRLLPVRDAAECSTP